MDTVIPNNSNQSKSIKFSAFNSLVHRLLMLPLTDDNFEKEVLCIKSIAYNNGSDPDIIDQIICKKQQKLAQNLLNNVFQKIKNGFI